MLWQRILTAVIGVPFAFFIVYLGKLPFFITILILSLLGLREYYRIMAKMELKPYCLLGYVTGTSILAATHFGFYNAQSELLLLFFLIGATILIVDYGNKSFQDLAGTFLGVFYVAGLFNFAAKIRLEIPGGFWWLILTLLLIWSNDSGAFFVGKRFGKHKLHQAVSPNKTIEGAVGGILATIIVALLFNNYIKLFSITGGIVLAIVVAVAGILGDLWESALKRAAGIKDSGVLLPGHGGILDRFDSLLFAFPAVYYLLQGFIID